MSGRYAKRHKGVPLQELKKVIAEAEKQRWSQDGNHVVLDGPEWDAIYKTLQAEGLAPLRKAAS